MKKIRFDDKSKFINMLNSFWSDYSHVPEIMSIYSFFKHIRVNINPLIPTARIILNKVTTEIEISPAFFQEYIKMPEDAGFVLCHEILHYVMGHGTIEGREAIKKVGKQNANLAMDMVINQYLYRFFKNPEMLFVTRFYSSPSCPVSLLKPLKTISPKNFRSKKCRNFYKIFAKESTLPQALEHVLEHAQNFYPSIGEIILYGRTLSELSETLKGILKKMKCSASGDGGELVKEKVEISNYTPEEYIVRKIESMLSENEKKETEVPFHSNGVLPFYGRSDFLFIPLEVFVPVFHYNPSASQSDEGVRIYLDVSASIFDELNILLSLLNRISYLIAFPIYGFSTKVVPIKMSDLKRGLYMTTYGTDFNLFAKHAINKGYNKIVLITDGFAQISSGLAQKLRANTKVLTILTNGGYEGEVRKFSSDIIAFSF